MSQQPCEVDMAKKRSYFTSKLRIKKIKGLVLVATENVYNEIFQFFSNMQVRGTIKRTKRSKPENNLVDQNLQKV